MQTKETLRNFGLKAHEIEDEVWNQPCPESKGWAYAVFAIALLAMIAVVILGG
jgi:hypothetical protein